MRAKLPAGTYLSQKEHDAVCPQCNGAQWKVYTALASMRNKASHTTPECGIQLIMTKTGLSRTVAFDAIKELKAKGLILQKGNGNRHSYEFPTQPR